MIPQHRRIIGISGGLGVEPGPLKYSGFNVVHPDAEKLQAPRHPLAHKGFGSQEQPKGTTTYFTVLWFWVPTKYREIYRWPSRVPANAISMHERAMLASGEIEEVRRDYTFLTTMAERDAYAWILKYWQRMAVQRMESRGYVLPGEYLTRPLVGQSREAAMPKTDAVRALEQKRNAIEIVSR